MEKGFDRRQKQTIASLQRYDEWDVIEFFGEDIDLTLQDTESESLGELTHIKMQRVFFIRGLLLCR